MVKKLLVAFLLVLVMVIPGAAADRWAGVYTVTGQNPDGSTYEGKVAVGLMEGTNLYQLVWVTGENVTQGVGYEHDGTLVVLGTNVPMLGSYKRNGEGRWIVPGARTPLVERWKKTKETSLAVPAPKSAPKPRVDA